MAGNLAAGQASTDNGGTEFFLSSTSATARRPATPRRARTASGCGLSPTPARSTRPRPNLQLSNKLIKADTYTLPPKATQKDGPTPLRDCINDTTISFGSEAARLLGVVLRPPARHKEVISPRWTRATPG